MAESSNPLDPPEKLPSEPKANILLVDDQPANLLALRAILEDQGQNVVDARSGEEALRRLLEDEFAVVLLDVQMPGLDGFETARLIRGRHESRRTPIIFLTAYDSDRFPVEQAYSLGAVDYLVKPLNPVIVRAKVAGFVELFEKTQQVKRQAERIRKMERREFEERLASENALLRERVRLAGFNRDVAQALVQSDTLSDMLRHSAEAMVRHLHGAFARIWTLDAKEAVLELQASAGLYTHLDGPHSQVPVGQYKIGLIAQERKPHLTNAVLNDSHVSDKLWAEREGMVAFAGYPLLVEDRLVGVMAMFARQPLSDATLEAMASVADGIALGIERKRSEERLRCSEQELADFFENATIGLHWVGPDGTILRANQAELDLLGYRLEEYVGRPISEFHADPEVICDILTRLQAGEQLNEYAARLRCKDGAIKDVLIDSSVLFRDGSFAHTRCFTRDVTERKRAEAALRDADRRKDEFLATLAHELRNPLAPIRNSLQILKMPRVDAATVQQTRDMMERQVHHLVRLVDDLLDVSRVMRGKIELRREPVELATVVARAVETAHPLIEVQGHRLDLSLPNESLLLDADPVRLAQVVGNLLTNAAKYTEANGRIWLTAQREGHAVVLRVRDNGIGIAPDMLPHVFELFVQVDHAATRSQGGLGIGLTLVKNLVEMHKGTVEARSAGLNKGCEFVVRLPLMVQERPQRNETEDGEPPQEPPCSSGHRLLVVDDNKDAAMSLAMLLRLQGHQVRVTHDGPSALGIAASYRPDIVFLDIGMPGMDGYEVARRMRQQPGQEKVVLAALTGWGQQEDRRRTSEAGFDHHLVKPLEPKALEALLDALRKPDRQTKETS